MTGTRGRPSDPVTWSRSGTVVLLLALTAALLAAVLPGGDGTPEPDRTMVAQLPLRPEASDLDGIAERARRTGVRLVILIPAPPRSLIPYRSRAQTFDAALVREIAALRPPAVVDLAGAADPGAVAGRQPGSAEVVDEHGAVLRAAEAPSETQDTPTLRVLGLLAVGLLVVPTARALRGVRGLTITAPRPGQGAPRDERGSEPPSAPSASDVGSNPPPDAYADTGTHVPPTPRTVPDPPDAPHKAPAAPLPPGSLTPPAPTPPPAFDILAFEATLTGPETGPQCPRCGSFDLVRTPAPGSAGSPGACGRCDHGWQLDTLGRQPQLLLEPDYFTPRPWGDGGDP
ncbi:hypothetical protein [Streptomyces phaeofaciens]|uniref:hypothetical protein n=1 Tax=Streptomyces phaeofaciens TaxID=68254 RepID=UPI0036988A22